MVDFNVLIEKDEDGIYVIECPLFPGCYSQGTTKREAMKNIEEVIELVLEEKECREIVENYAPQDVSLYYHKISI
ncbi:MAG: type II toxin-antitoxin system HicB family antitoxin [Candidatus Peribacteraceae bacterium]|nr:type II toxin-antitoxin system HicB family antitoxin [Candidatus Peribacteraceae bacterium]